MSEQNRPAQMLPISGILALLAVLGVVMFTTSPYKGDRPFISETYELSNRARARLWQDPFRAVLDHEEMRRKQGLGIYPSATSTIGYEPSGNGASGKITILGVMVFGGPYAEDSEWRMRTRYAVLSALGKLGYTPVDEDHVGYIQYDPERKKNNPTSFQALTLLNIVPYEWVNRWSGEQDKREVDKILILWMNDDAFQFEQRPLHNLADLIDKNILKKSKFSVPADSINIRILGPAGSTNLIAMVNELRKPQSMEMSESRKDISIYSGVATADLEPILQLPDNEEYLLESKITRTVRNRTVSIERTIGKDTDLAPKIVEELCLRDVNADQPECTGASSQEVHNHRDHIVLVSEWDTFYGRSLPDAFQKAFLEKNRGSGENGWIHQFSYMRGIDGIVPGDKPESASDQDKNGKGVPTRNDADHVEQPTGKSQFDYLRRLAERIQVLDARLKTEGSRGVRVIGILGSDFYDKYLVLQALRQRFPDVIFFTTDMDARLLHPEHLRWTRNILVASHYNLQTKRDIQDEVPPFRDCYQTSVFLTTLRIFDYERYKKIIARYAPRIYEIGRKRACRLSKERTDVNAALESNEFLRTKGLPWKISLLVLSLGFLLYKSSYGIRATMIAFVKCIRRHPWIFTTMFSLVILLAWWFSVDIIGNSHEEPIQLDNGVSIWPTELIRLVAALAAIAFMIRGLRRLGENCRLLGTEFGLAFPEAGVEGERKKSGRSAFHGSFRRSIRNLSARISLYSLDRAEKRYDGNIVKLWRKYACRGESHARSIRTLLYVLFYLAFGFGLMTLFGFPYNPIRGAKSQIIDKVVLSVSILSYLGLTFLVVDATRLCRVFIKAASKQTPRWGVLLNKFREDVNGAGRETAALSEWLLIRLIAIRTEVVATLVFYPFLVLFILIVSRANFFDNWTPPIPLAVIIGLTAVYTWSCAFVLRKSAEQTRREVLDRLSLIRAKFETGNPGKFDQAEHVKRFMDEVRDEHRGAFAPFTQQPVVQALIVPFGGVGSVALLNFLEKLNV